MRKENKSLSLVNNINEEELIMLIKEINKAEKENNKRIREATQKEDGGNNMKIKSEVELLAAHQSKQNNKEENNMKNRNSATGQIAKENKLLKERIAQLEEKQKEAGKMDKINSYFNKEKAKKMEENAMFKVNLMKEKVADFTNKSLKATGEFTGELKGIYTEAKDREYERSMSQAEQEPAVKLATKTKQASDGPSIQEKVMAEAERVTNLLKDKFTPTPVVKEEVKEEVAAPEKNVELDRLVVIYNTSKRIVESNYSDKSSKEKSWLSTKLSEKLYDDIQNIMTKNPDADLNKVTIDFLSNVLNKSIKKQAPKKQAPKKQVLKKEEPVVADPIENNFADFMKNRNNTLKFD